MAVCAPARKNKTKYSKSGGRGVTGKILYIDDKKTTEWPQSRGLQLPKEESNGGFYEKSIPRENTSFNNQYNQKNNAIIIDKLTNTPISDEADNVLKRHENDENVSVEEMYRIPEISNAKQKVGDFIPTSEITTPQRQALRQEITDKLYKMGSFSHMETIDGHKKEVYNGNIEKNKIVDIVIGATAAGKSSVFVNPLSSEHKARVIDSDMAKELLPEFDNGYGAGVVHEESTDIANKVLDTAVKNGENIVYPILGSDLQSLVKKIDRFKENGYTVNLHLNELSANKAAGRAIKRFFTDGRFLDPALLNGVGNMPTQNYKALRQRKGYLDGYSHYSNDVKFGEQPIRYETNIPIKGVQDISNANGLRSDRTQELHENDGRIEGRTQTQGTGRGEQPEITSSNRRVI